MLALEFSSAQRSVAVANAGRVVSEVIETGGRGTNALAMVDEALREAKVEREQIECLAVGLGPGSYTGIRASISVAQGWQLARGVNLIGISSAECVAAQAQADGLTGRVNVVIDAQRGELYVASYEIEADERREIMPLQPMSMEQAQALEKMGGVMAGPEVTRWLAIGKILYPRAATLAELSASRTDFVSGEELEPMYLRETHFIKAPPPRAF